MGLRDAISRNPLAAVVIIVALLGLAVWRIAGRGSSAARPASVHERRQWFWDLETGKLRVDVHGGRLPPVPAATGGASVHAVVLGCGDCRDANRYVAFLQQYNDEGKALAENPPEGWTGDNPGRLISLPPDDDELEWVAYHSQQGRMIQQQAANRPDCESVVQCPP